MVAKKRRLPRYHTEIAWLLLLLLWVCTLWINDVTPKPLTVIWFASLVVFPIYGLVVAFFRRNYALGCFSLITPFVWVILFCVVVFVFGFSEEGPIWERGYPAKSPSEQSQNQ
ncbi:hypothetical protein CUTER_03665 [Corynebacterium uterequi]|uniref:Uncharacterized protein n=1 Tax=Corynebacterium uterequi TaxID=1072256 RepID=A0A0G3HBH6_9CORY|nr:hypothetical protein CUTER_03665 [Corynebacterium uterequi]